MQVVGIGTVVNASVTVTGDIATISGAGAANSRLVASHANGAIVYAYDPSAPRHYQSLDVCDLTVDGNGGFWGLGFNGVSIKRVRLRNLKFVNYTGVGLHAIESKIDAADLAFEGEGIAMLVNGSAPFKCRRFTVTGGRGGFVKAHDDIVNRGILLLDGLIQHDYWLRDGFETAGVVDGDTVTVDELHVDELTIENLGDFVRFGSGDAAVMGHLVNWGGAGNRTLTVNRWRDTWNRTVAAPASGPCAIVDRQTDVGAVHLTPAVEYAHVERIRVRGGSSDMITARGNHNTVKDCFVERGRDMGFTVEGSNILTGCVARNVQVGCFTAEQFDGAARLENCRAEGSFMWDYDDSLTPWGVKRNCATDATEID